MQGWISSLNKWRTFTLILKKNGVDSKTLKNRLTPYNPTFFCSVYRVYGTQNDRLELTVSMQISVLKNMQWGPRYWPKISRFGLATFFWHILLNISGPRAYISKPIFALKPWAQSGGFEYHKPYKWNEIEIRIISGLQIFKGLWGWSK